MRTNTLIIALFFCALFTVSVRAQHWEYVSSLQNEWLQKICTQGLDTVFIVGRDGLIARSTDRAVSWNVQHFPTKANLNDVVFLNHLTGYAVGVGGTMLKTTDGGLNWNSLNSGTTHNLNAIAAMSLNNIWAVGDSGTVVYSNDGGNSWEKKDFSTIKRLNDISFRNGTGYIVGNDSVSLKTVDFGNSWTKYIVNVLDGRPHDLLSVIQTNNADVKILCGGHDNTTGNNVGLYINSNNILIFYPQISFGNYYTSFGMLNDSIGYGFSWDVTTGNSGVFISIQNFNLNRPTEYSYAQVKGYNGCTMSSYYSDMCIVNDSVGYIVSGMGAFKLVKSSLAALPKIESVKTNLRLISCRNNHIVLSANQNIQSIEIYSFTGIRCLQYDELNDTNISVFVGSLPLGTYLIRTFFADKSSSVTKWIKQ